MKKLPVALAARFFICIIVALSFMYVPVPCFSKNFNNLSGRYKGYNVILIVCDALRPDHLSCYGYKKGTSPNIDALARQGVIFKNAFSQGALTLPCVASLFTSLYPLSHNMLFILKDELPKEVNTLAEVLNIYGYKNIWFGPVKDPHTGSAKGLLRGFIKEDYFFPDSGHKIFDYIQENKFSPFFITIHTYQTHEDLFPYNRFSNKFSSNINAGFLKNIDRYNWIKFKRKLMNNNKVCQSEEKINKISENMKSKTWGPAHSWFSSLDKAGMSEFLALLDSSIYELDNKLIGELVSSLKKLNLYEKTIIIITADHGNEYQEHGRVGHNLKLYDESIHVPLIFYLPGYKRVINKEDLVQSIDIMPTILDLLGLPIPYYAQGISLREMMENKAGALTNKYVYGFTYSVLSIRAKRWKLLVKFNKDLSGSNARLRDIKNLLSNDDTSREGLFDLKNDPYEKKNLILKKPDIALYLRAALKSEINNLHSYQIKNNEFPVEVNEETKKKIIERGYW